MTKEQTLSHYSSQLEIARLMEENERLKKDAERYQWIRCHVTAYRYGTDEQGLRLPEINQFLQSGNVMRGSIAGHLDSAIDAALMGEKK